MRRLNEQERHVQAQQDLELVRRALDGDPRAESEVLGRMNFVPRAIASKNAEFGRPLGPAELEDLGQDVLMSLWRKLEDYAGTGTLEAWIYRFCFLQLLSHLRKRKRRPRLLDDLSVDASEISAAPIRHSMDNERIYTALDDVGPPDADILRLKHMEDLTFEQIGRRLEISPNTAKSRYYRGLKRMRHLLESGMSPAEKEQA